MLVFSSCRVTKPLTCLQTALFPPRAVQDFAKAGVLSDDQIDHAVKEVAAQEQARSEAKLGVQSNSVQPGDEVDEDDEEGGYFRALGVKSTVNDADVKKAYREKMNLWHPDRVKDPSMKQEAETMYFLVQTAFRVLSDPCELQHGVRFLGTDAAERPHAKGSERFTSG